MPSNTQRIARNTLMLYFRQILIMLVSLYTVRVVLETLGAEDYGIYNVVAGVVTMFGFLSGSMAGSSERYFAVALGGKNLDESRKLFGINFLFYALIGTVILLLAETVGIWFIRNKLIIPVERAHAVQWVYQFSIGSFLCSILATPYMAVILAHEDMKMYAHVSILEALLKLVCVCLLYFISMDKLQLYSILLCLVAFIVMTAYIFICIHTYQECKFQFFWNKALFKEITTYTGWNLLGHIAGVFKNQAINVLLNQFFSPVVIAARGISFTVTNAVSGFSTNFFTAMNPQIFKCFAAEKKEEMLDLIFLGTKGAFFLLYICMLPLMLELPLVMSIWLKNPPEYTVLFTRLMLITVLINSVTALLTTAIQATGKIILFRSVLSSIEVLNFPIAWIVLLFGCPAYSVMVVTIFITSVSSILCLFIAKRLIDFSLVEFFQNIILPITSMGIIASILPLVICYTMAQSMIRLCITVLVSIFSTCACMYFICLKQAERQKVNRLIKNRIRGVSFEDKNDSI
ncbi:hypothetical protein FACS189461_3680 [Spirochaetia bacterium]|nr:hypothetical protein FACS189461_3680 [Spirochaetia bacterium]